MKKLNKKGQGGPLQLLISGAILVLIAVITVAIAISINVGMGDSINTATCTTNLNTSTSGVRAPASTCGPTDADGLQNWSCACAQWNATLQGTTGLAAFSNYWVSIVSIIILVVIVGLFAYFKGGTGGIEIQ